MRKSNLKEHLLLHFIVLLWGFTGILGKLIAISAVHIVWYRMLIAFIGLLIWFRIIGFPVRAELKAVFRYLGIGLIVAAHWIAFFLAIKLSTVSVALATLASASLFTSFLEPLFFNRRIIGYEIVFGVFVIVGLVIIFNFETQYTAGILTALASAFLASLFTVLNGKMATRGHKPRIMTLYEMCGGFLGVSLYFILSNPRTLLVELPSMTDFFYLLILGLICTAFAFLANINILRFLSPYTVSISINMEPVYAIVLAFLFFGDDERMSSGFYLGAAVIMATIIADAVLKNRHSKRKSVSV